MGEVLCYQDMGTSYSAGAWILVGESELDGVIADILRPTRDEIAEAPPVVGEQGSGGLFEPRKVPRDGRHEAIGGLLRSADAVPVAAGPARLFHQLAKSYGSAAWL